ncbi:hypothetical protein RB598_008868 [Gaeumannomyces tritici]
MKAHTESSAVRRQEASHERKLGYWRTQLADGVSAEFLTDQPRPAGALSGKTAVAAFTIEDSLHEAVQGFSRAREATTFAVLLAAFRAAHYRFTGAEDAIVGTSKAGPVGAVRSLPADTLCLRIAVGGSDTLAELTARAEAAAAAALAHGDVPLGHIASALQKAGQNEKSRAHLVRILFGLHSQGEGLPVEPSAAAAAAAAEAALDLELHLAETTHGRLDGKITYSTDLFQTRSIDGIIAAFREILRGGIEQPAEPVSALPLGGLDELAAMGLLGVKRTNYARDSNVVDLFRSHVAATPHALAVVDAAERLTYAQLDARSDATAAWLRRRAMPAEALVAVLAPRSCEAVAAFLAVLKANLAYVPLDPAVPAARVAEILSAMPGGGRRLVLVGRGVCGAEIPGVDVELVRLDEAVDTAGAASAAASTVMPLATSLAYVMFTSGSTGRPKGVMIEHRGIVRLVTDRSVLPVDKAAVPVAHIANPAFDMATWEIYTALLNGGTVVCVDHMTVLDPKALAAVFEREKVRAAVFTPAFLKQYLYESPSTFSQLDMLLSGGDAIRPQDALRAAQLVRHAFCNAYGPTENTGISTMYRMGANEQCANGVPIGRAYSNSGAYVMDPLMRPVPLGVLGELVVTGDGLARGYTDAALDRDRFVTIQVGEGEPVRAYRTGDRVRWRPTDGQIEFFGRIDQQVKIRGHRIELAEVEKALLGHGGLRDAAVVVHKDDSGEPEMIGFVEPRAGDTAGDEEDGQVEIWVNHYEQQNYATLGGVDGSAVGNDFVGWTSMYDGSAIDRTEMQEWLDDTIRTVLNGRPPGRVLEIGTGSGMILFNLAKAGGLENYVGIEPSKSAASFVTQRVASIPELAGRVQMNVGTAEDLGSIDAQQPELVVVNSVAQLFPSPEYLLDLVRTIAAMPTVRRVYFGDMRSHAIDKQFLAGRALHSLGENPRIAKAEFRARIEEMEDREEELLVGPAFFTGLTALLPNRVRHVEVIPKRMVATNELSCYRYAAVIHLNCPHGVEEPPRTVDTSAWVDFRESAMDRDSLAELLKGAAGEPATVAVANIPYSKTIVERQILASLEDEANDEDDEAWVVAARLAAQRCPSLSALDLARMAEEAGFRVEISWARQLSRRAALDAVFHRFPAAAEGARVLFEFPTDDAGAPPATFANRPLQKLQSRRVEAEVRDRVQALLPSYMVPDRIVVLDRMPVNANGKVDRKELARMAKTTAKKTKVASSSTRVAPRDEVEAAVCDEFLAVLGIEVGIEDNFFDQGGHSLMATRLASRLSRRLDADVSVKDIFDQPVLKDLAASIRRSSSAYSPITGVPYSGPVEQSFAQGRLWFLGQLNISTAYVVPLATRLRGQLQVDALEAALHTLEQRHETLRTTFRDGDDGVGIQVVRSACARKKLRVIDASGDFAQILREEQAVSFDLGSEPGWKVSLLRIAPDDYILSIVMHHIIADGWSFGVVRKDLSRLYSAAANGRDPLAALEPLPIQYRDFSLWQKLPEQAAEHQRQLEYWKTQLADSSPAELLCDRKRPAFLSGEAGIVQFTIEGAAYERLQAFCRAHQTTAFVVLLAAFRAAHYRLTGADDATVGTPIANRNRPELENLIGFFVNTQCMRITVEEEDTTFDTLVKQVRATATAAFANQDVPFERIVSALLRGSQDASRNPLVQLLFALHSQTDLDRVELEGMSAEPAPGPMATRLDMEFHLFQAEHSLSGKVLYSVDLFERKTIEGVVAVFQEVLRRGLDRPQTPISALPLTDGLDGLDAMGLMHIERTAYPRDSSVVDIFRQQAAALPNATAVTDSSGRRLTYAQLDAESDQTAAWLRRRGIPAETLIGVLAPRSCEAVVAFMGILKAKLAYIPLDVNVPGARIGAILEAAECKLLLLGRGVPPPDTDLTGVDVIRINSTLDHSLAGGLSSPLGAEVADGPLATNLAYVMFTSGSTGKPKGVMIEHRGIVRLVKDTNVVTSAASAVPVAHVTTLSFDLSTWELYAPLLNGGSVVCIDYMTLLDPAALAKVFEREQVRAALLTPAFLKQCLASPESAAAIAQLNALLACGERLDVQDAIAACKVATKCGIVNAYGPTENTVFSTMFKMTLQEGCPNGVPIGRSLTNSGSYIMDGRQRLVPIGVVGELVLTGDGLARGYTDSALDRDRFTEVEIAGEIVKAYRTGDKARYRPTDGEMEFFGRMDQQVKIRGHRIELAEVEAGLLRHEAVTDAAVVVRNTQEGQEPEMIAFVRAPRLVEQQSQAAAEAEILSRLRVFLPKYMIPEGVVLMDQMPLNANGKVDRKELGRLAQTAARSEVQVVVAVAARDEVELAVCDECAGVLGAAEVGVSDDFFALGGHSLMATKLAARLSRRLGTAVSVKDVFDRPVLADLAAKIRRSGSASHSPIKRVGGYSGPVQQSFAQGRVWFMEQLAGGTASYLMSMATRLRGALNIHALEAALGALEQRHETLRTVFDEVDGVGVQKVLDSGRVKLKVMSLSPEDDDFSGLLLKQQTTPFDLKSEPAWRVSLIQLPGVDDNILSIVMHHIIADGWSIDVLRQELGAYYAAALRGGHVPLLEQIAPLPIQYRDFSVWQREPAQAEDHGRQLEYWKTQLADSTPAEFLPDRPRPSVLSGGAAFRAAHYRLTGVEDATIGSLIANRNRPEIENLIGFFVNTQCMRMAVGDGDSFQGLVEQTRTTAAAAFANQDVPFERIVSSLRLGANDMSRNPLVQTMLVLHSQEDLDRIQLEGLIADPVPGTATTRLDVEFHMLQRAGSLSGRALYSTDLFEPKTIRCLVSVFLTVLRQGPEQPQEPISTLPLIKDGLDEICGNSGTFIMDRRQQLVPPGVMGELVVTGYGLARRYAGSDLDRNRVVEIEMVVGNTPIKAYRTGDRARYRPTDGQLEFFGRMDQQIKVGGHHIEVAEVEAAILKQDAVADAAVVVQAGKIIAFMTTKATKNTPPDHDDDASGQVDGWVTHFDKATYTDIDKIEDTTLGNDFMGWTSMYDGSLIDRAEMQEWLDETMQAMLEGAAPGRVLEIGTGSGMILFNLARAAAGGLERYWGLEPSPAATRFVNDRVKADAMLAGRVHMHVGTAADVGHLELRPELVVINSVIQYFPTCEYLAEIIDQLVRTPGVKRIFFGDVRSYAINKQFLASRALRSLGASATKAGVRQIIAELTESEEELLVDPAFFTSLKKRLPDLVHHVEILPKRMTASNELSSYRYAAVVHVSQENARPVHTIDQAAWVDFEASGMSREGLASLLRSAPADATIAIENIPWRKTMLERLVVESLDTEGDAQNNTVDGAAWISTARSAAERRESLSAADLARLAGEAGFRAEVSWARQRSRAGALDAVFHRIAAEGGARVLYRFPTDDEPEGSPAAPLTSQPLERLHRRRVEAQIREGLQKMLPAHMVPQKIVVLGCQLRVGADGKVDREELGRMAQAIQKPSAVASVHASPKDDTEAVVCEEFGSVLGVGVGINDNFFDQGGHSLMATKLAARLSRRLNTDISVKNIFDQPVLSDLADTIRRISASHKPIAKTTHDGPVKLSFAQGRLWFLDQIDLGKTAYIIPLATRLRGPLNTEALEAAIRALETRHETLRTTFHETDGVGMQAVGPVSTIKINMVDMSAKTHQEYAQLLWKEQTTAFDLAAQPGWRVALIKLGQNDHILSVVMHHIISDGWSIDVMRRELGQFYAAAVRGRDPLSAVPALPIQYRDFAAWQAQQSAEHGRQLQYWKKMLADSSPAELLTDKPRPATLSGDAGVVPLAIDGPMYEDLQAFCRYHQTTSFTVLLAAFRAAHYRLTTGAEIATIGTPIANRNRPELENMIGFFVNTQCMKIAVGKDDTFEGLVRQVRSTTTAAFANQDVPFERVVSELLPGLRDSSTSRNPLVQLMFALHSQQDLERIPLEGLAAEAVPGNPTTRMDLEFHLLQGRKGLDGRVLYSKDLFEEKTADGIVAVFLEILRRGLDRPRTPLSTLPLTDGLGEVRSMGLLDIRQTDYPKGSVVDAFRKQAAAHPDATAVIDSSARMTYRELDEKSSRLETWLRRRKGTSPESLVGVLAPRSCEAIVAFLGVLKANLAYIPLDTNAPAARIATILSTVAGKTLVLLGRDTPPPDCSTTAGVELIRIADALRSAGPAEAALAYQQQPSASSLAYVMFTSGSTGRPKGVMVEHRGVVRLASEPDVALRGAPIAHMANTAFDAATWEIYTAILSGGTLVCIGHTTVLDPVELGGVFADKGIRGALFTPALLKQCMTSAPAALAGLDLLVVGADRFPPQSAIEAARLVRGAVFNAYGPTENSCISTKYRVPVGEENYVNGVPIGRAIANSGAFVMDGQQKVVPIGVMGELVVTGDGLARGYTDPALNDGRFVSVTINGRTTRAYRTGDRVRYRADGQIEFFGRMDQQIKIRGHRIELAEVEHAIIGHDAVQDAAVIVRVQKGQVPEMVGFVAARPDGAAKQPRNREEQFAAQVEEEICRRLQALLPSYMVPERIVVLDQMPLNANGKVDRKTLARMAQTVPKRVDSTTDEVFVPTGEVDKIIHAVIAEVVNLPPNRVPANRSFIGLGGDSITAMQVMALCRQGGVSLGVQDILKSATIADMAARANRLSLAGAPAQDGSTETLGKEDEFAPFPLSPIQKLYFAQFPNGENHYNQSMLLKLQRPTPESVVREALSELVRHHSMLRARFQRDPAEGQWMQRVSPNADEAFSFARSNVPTWEEAQGAMLEAERCLDITSGPMLAARSLHIGESTSLFLVAHHLVVDLVSWRVLLRDLEQLIGGISLPKTQESWSYQRWVRSLQSYAETEASAAALTLPFAVPEPNIEFWGIDESSPNNDSTNLAQGEFTLGPFLTDILLRAAEKTLRAEVPDVLLAMAAHTFAVIFPERAAPSFHTETHGRDHPRGGTAIPVHETVGWFTAIVPLVITAAGGSDYVDSVIQAKDIRRTVPGLGVPYFTSKMLRGPPQKPTMEIMFNYLGRFQQLERPDGLFELLPGSTHPVDVGLSVARLSVIDVSAVVERGALTVSWNYNAKIHHQDKLARWFSLYEQALTEVTSALQKALPRLTSSDVPLLCLPHVRLGALNEALAAVVSRGGVEAVQDVYPTSPMQRGILLSRSKDASQYDVHAVWEISPCEGRGAAKVDTSRLRRAWRHVVRRHPMLRTVFIDAGLRDDSPFDQVVLRELDPSITFFTCGDDDKAAAMEKLWDSCRGDFDPDASAHRLAICACPGGKAYAHLQVSHALVDATSLQILLRDWARAYADDLPAGPGLSYSSYIAHIQNTSPESSLRFWTARLEGATVCRLPRLTDGIVRTGHGEMRRLHVDVPFGHRLDALARRLRVSVANIFQLAWALVLRSYTDAQDVCFGYIASGRDVELDGISDAVGPFINILVSRLVFDQHSTAATMLRRFFAAYVDGLPHQHAPLADILHALQVPGGQLFNTALSFQKLPTGQPQDLELSFRFIRGDDPTEFDVMLNVLSGDSINFSIDYRDNFLTQAQAINIGQSLVQALSAIEATPDAGVDSLELLPPKHLSQLKRWGEAIPPLVDRTVHCLFGDACRARPDASAIHAWDAHFSYAELDDASSRLAGLLVERGIEPGSFVAMCFEKSAWVAVAFLAIHKVGAAFLLLEPDAPRERTQYMLEKTEISMVLCSAACSASVEGWGMASMVVDKDAIAAPAGPACRLPDVPSSSAAYVVFTSGTTGQPKGAVVEHGAFCTAAVAQAQNMSIGPESRCLQFASFAFDIAMLEMVTPLLVGGCVCMPQKQDMVADLPGVVRNMKVTWAFLTPSFARTLSPEAGLAPLETLFLGGEPLSQRDIDAWADKVRLGNGYGPAECAVISSAMPRATRSTEASNIGHPSGCARWVTELGNRQRLVPIGAVGELLLEGAPLSRGYVNDPARTAEVFVAGLAWAPHVGRTPETRFYATGDLVRLNSDGSLTFVGRRDDQVKIHGQRIELGEIHHHLATMHEIRHSVVLSPSEGPLRGRLVAVLELKDSCSTADAADAAATHEPMRLVAPSMRPRAAECVGRIRNALARRLPAYMVPTTWIAVHQIPMMVSRKLHLPTVQAWIEGIDEDTYRNILAVADATAELDPSEKVARQISRRLGDLLGGAGNVLQDVVGKDIVPMQFGLDSIAAITLSSWIRKTFTATVPMATLLSPQASVRTLAALVQEEKTGPSTARRATAAAIVNLRAELQRLDQRLARLLAVPKKVTPKRLRRNHFQTPSTFLVTGSTGFLGSQIVRQLLLRAAVKRVFCLVRADNDDQAWERMMDAARKGEWWRPDLAERLTTWSGDLARPHLGLDAARWARVAGGDVDAIIHNGAVVHWHLGYHDIRAANVGSTFDLLSALSTATSPPRLAYVSGGYFGTADETDNQVADLLSDSGGYAQTKFISEVLVGRHGERLAAASPDFPMPVVLKPGFIIGDGDLGVSNLDDFLWRVVGSAVRVGGYNADEADDPDAWLLAAGSDQIASAAVDACMLPPSAASKRAVRFVDGVPVKELWRVLAEDPELGFELKPMSCRDWLATLERDMNARGPAHPIFPVFDFLRSRRGTVGVRRIRDEEAVFPETELRERVRRSLIYLKTIGFFSANGAASQPKVGVFNRSGWSLRLVD